MLDPCDLGFDRAAPSDLRGGDPATNAAITRAILAGEDRSPKRDVTLLNAAAALHVGAVATDLADGITKAMESLDSGAALRKLEGLVVCSQEMTS